MTRRHWLLPHDADLLGMLREQVAITLDGFDALVAWAGGDAAAEARVRDREHRADDAKRALWRGLRDAFSPPMDAEDLFTLSSDLDEALNGAKDLVREMEVMAMAPDGAMHGLAVELRAAVADLLVAFDALGDAKLDPTTAADGAVRHRRRVERLYRDAMSALLAADSPTDVAGRREAYRRMAGIGDILRRVADRVWYATVKEA